MAPDMDRGHSTKHVNGFADSTETPKVAADIHQLKQLQRSRDSSLHESAHYDRSSVDADELPPNGAGHNTDRADSYDERSNPRGSAPPIRQEDIPLPSVKIEPAADELEYRPMFDGTSDYPTSKTLANLKSGKSSRASPSSDRSSPAASVKGTVSKKKAPANLKNGTTSRASTSDRSSPATSVKPVANKKQGSAATKKGTAKKPAPKRRKLQEEDTESLDGRSNTPASRTSKTPGRKQGSASIASSPVPEERRKPKKPPKSRLEDLDMDVDEEDDEDEDDSLYCICRKVDNHEFMVGCDGQCEDWYHGKCVQISEQDEELIERFICPLCVEKGVGYTTWKPKCRLMECRKPARAARKPPSKYCSDVHGQEFMRRQIGSIQLGPEQVAQPDLGSMGGILTPSDLRAVVEGVGSITEFRNLGNRILAVPQDEDTKSPINGHANGEPKPDVESKDIDYSIDELVKIEKIRKAREELLHHQEMLVARSTFVGLLRQRSKSLVEKFKELDPKGGWKDICGFDSRLSWSDEEFDEWRLSDAGKAALQEGTIEALAASYPRTTDADGDMAMEADEENTMAYWTRGVCNKKRCERHKQWIKVQQQENFFEESAVTRNLAQNEQESRTLSERAVLRMWAEKENAPFHSEQKS